jgi:hypothetical protein
MVNLGFNKIGNGVLRNGQPAYLFSGLVITGRQKIRTSYRMTRRMGKGE